jgi:hypothetical protein
VFVAPAALRASEESTQASHHRYAETVRRSLHDGLRLIPRSPRSAGLDSLRRLPELLSVRLDPSVGGSGPRGFARPRATSYALSISLASIASRSNVCGDWPNAPPGGSGTGGSDHLFLKNGRRIFLRRGLDSSGKSVIRDQRRKVECRMGKGAKRRAHPLCSTPRCGMVGTLPPSLFELRRTWSLCPPYATAQLGANLRRSNDV